jgi:5,5'-dehydrodivanillate O-demethylase oxygenase subunit
MLTAEENELLTRIGQGTPMGEGAAPLLASGRLFGMGHDQAAAHQDAERGADALSRAEPALMQLRCAHRSVALDYGRVKGDCIRCPYHGWLYDATGQCLEQPAEPAGSRYKDEIRMRAYPTQEMGGLVFGYMGPEPAPLLPLYDLLRREDGVKMIQVGNVSANWMNHVDNIVDISHLTWLHGYTFPAYGGKRVTYHWERTESGADRLHGSPLARGGRDFAVAQAGKKGRSWPRSRRESGEMSQ